MSAPVAKSAAIKAIKHQQQQAAAAAQGKARYDARLQRHRSSDEERRAQRDGEEGPGGCWHLSFSFDCAWC